MASLASIVLAPEVLSINLARRRRKMGMLRGKISKSENFCTKQSKKKESWCPHTADMSQVWNNKAVFFLIIRKWIAENVYHVPCDGMYLKFHIIFKKSYMRYIFLIPTLRIEKNWKAENVSLLQGSMVRNWWRQKARESRLIQMSFLFL